MGQTIGEKIAALRKEKHITQTELAEYLFLVPQTVSKWEVGNGTPDISLLPRIADFFGVSVDELFGRSALDRTKDLVLKYSVLRDENSFRDAQDCIRSQLQTIEAALKNQMGDREELEREKVQLEANMMHLLLQQGWESGQRALDIAESLVERTGEMPFRQQRVQLYTMLGKNHFILTECRQNFRESPGLDTLCLYFEVLDILGRCEEILEICGTDAAAGKLMMPPSKQNMPLWTQCAIAAAEAGDMPKAEEYAAIVSEYGDEWQQFDILWDMARMYKENGQGQKLIKLKEKLLSMLEALPGLPENPYFKQVYRQDIEKL